MSLGDVIWKAGARHRIDPVLVAAVILKESEGYQFAFRQERGFARRYGILTKPKADLPGFWPERTADPKWEHYERQMRCCSIGYMQIMVQTARELGYKGIDPWPDLSDSETNLEFGCKKLARCLSNHGGKLPGALLEYNGGGDFTYDDSVLSYYKNGTAMAYLSSLFGRK